MKPNTMKGVCCICGAFLIHFSLGTIYTFGNMSPYMASYLKFKTDNPQIKIGDTVWILAGTFFFMGTLMAAGGQIATKIGARLTCLFGCWTMSLNVTLTYLTIKRNIWFVILTYGFGFGIGIGISYSVALAAAMKWFPQKRGLVSGIVVGGFGLGSFLFSIIQTMFINPRNIPPKMLNGTSDYFNTTESMSSYLNFTRMANNVLMSSKEKYFLEDSILDRVPMCFIIIGVTYAVIQTIGVSMLMDCGSSQSKTEQTKEIEETEQSKQMNEIEFNVMNDKEQDQEQTLIQETKISNKESIAENVDEKTKLKEKLIQKEFSVGQAVKNGMFWLLWATFLFNGIVIVTISAVFKSFGQLFISDDQYFAILGAVGGICNCVGRVVWGQLLDKFNYRIVMSVLTVLMAVTMGTFYFCCFIPDVAVAKAIYFIWGCLLFVALSGTFAILPGATAQCFGSLNLATIYGLIISGLAVASIIGAIVSSFLFKYMQFHGQFIMATVAALISLAMAQFYKPPTISDDEDKIFEKESELKA